MDRTDFKGDVVNATEQIENVSYYFSHQNPQNTSLINYQEIYNFNSLEKYQEMAIKRPSLYGKEDTKPLAIHSASNFVVGLALRLQRTLGFLQFTRYVDSGISLNPPKREGYESSDHYKLSERFEIETAKESDYVFTITQALKQILVENGVEEARFLYCLMLSTLQRFNLALKGH